MQRTLQVSLGIALLSFWGQPCFGQQSSPAPDASMSEVIEPLPPPPPGEPVNRATDRATDRTWSTERTTDRLRDSPTDRTTDRATDRTTDRTTVQTTGTTTDRTTSQTTNRPSIGAIDPRLALPELPPIQPILPEVNTVRLVLKLQERRLYVYDGERVKTSYPVAVGRAGWETPVGQFKVLEMVREPGWTNPFTSEVVPPGPDNPLGERWIAFWTDGTNYVGFHGTPNRDSVGRSASHGCVRLFNEHVRELFEVVQVGTPVQVVH